MHFNPLRQEVARIALLLFAIGQLGCGDTSSSEAAGDASTSEAAGEAPSPAFTDVTEAAGLGAFRHETGAFGQKWMPESLGAGCGFLDYNGDGRPDILLVRGAVWPGQGQPIPALELYRNEGGGSFTNVTSVAGLDNVSAYGFGVAAADYDADGDEDIFLTTLGENRLLRNDGGVFADVSAESGLADRPTWSTAAVFFDADGEGRPDLYVGNYVPWTPETDKFCTSDGRTKDYCTPHQYEGVPGRFYRNNGDGTFSDRSLESGFAASPGKTLGAAPLDFNSDGWTDLVVANDTQPNLLYRNNGDGTFDEIGVESGIAYDTNGRARAGMGIDVAVLDGTPHVVIGNFSEEMVGLFRYMGNELFVDRAAAVGIGQPSFQPLTFGLFFFDADLDGHLDLMLANGHIIEHIQTIHPSLSYRQNAQLFHGQDDGTFVPAESFSGDAFQQKVVARGAAHADIDGDGDLDILLTENGGPAHLWRNERNPAAQDSVHYLRVHLEGAPPNRDALGARIVAVTAGVTRERWIRTGSSYLSQSEKTATFGLGGAARIDTLRIYWPSGAMETHRNVAADQTLHLVESSTAPRSL